MILKTTRYVMMINFLITAFPTIKIKRTVSQHFILKQRKPTALELTTHSAATPATARQTVTFLNFYFFTLKHN